MKTRLSPIARVSLNEIIHFLQMRWSERELHIMKNDIKKFRVSVKDGIVKHQRVENFPHIYFTLIGKKQVKLFYEIKQDEVLIKLFWHCRQNPRK